MFAITRTVVTLIVASLTLAACGQADNASNAASDSRKRLSSKNAYAQFGEYTIHVSAMLTSDLTPEVARGYGIVRSENQGLVNLVLLKKSTNMGTDMPVAAKVSLSAANLTGQQKGAEVREIIDGPSTYYVSQASVDDRETINFDFDVRPVDSNRELLVRFTHQFYTK
jgi:hypothetical protein